MGLTVVLRDGARSTQGRKVLFSAENEPPNRLGLFGEPYSEYKTLKSAGRNLLGAKSGGGQSKEVGFRQSLRKFLCHW